MGLGGPSTTWLLSSMLIDGACAKALAKRCAGPVAVVAVVDLRLRFGRASSDTVASVFASGGALRRRAALLVTRFVEIGSSAWTRSALRFPATGSSFGSTS